MANARTLAQLRTSVQTRGGYEYSRDITAAILNEFINEAIAETYDILVSKWADYYTIPSNNLSVIGTFAGLSLTIAMSGGVATTTIGGTPGLDQRMIGQRVLISNTTGGGGVNNGVFTVIAVPSSTTIQYLNPIGQNETAFAASAIIDGTSAVPLPANFYKLRKVEVKESPVTGVTDGTDWRRLYPIDLDVSHRFTNPVYSKGYRYRIQRDTLQLVPVPASTEVLRLYYIPAATRLSADTDTFDGINGYEELVIQLAFKRCRDREEIDTSSIDAEIARLTARVRTAADSRDAGEPFYLDPYGPAGSFDVSDEDEWW